MNIELVGLVSCYLEGKLVQGAVRSLLPWCDRVYVFEGPAGDPIEEDVPETDLGDLAHADNLLFHAGKWRSDARKRSDIIARVKKGYERRPEQPVWGLWLDGDEVLFNGEYLRDWLQILQWTDELNPEREPFLGKPLRMIELDGSMVWTRGRLTRIDLVKHYEVSTATFVNERGIVQGGGNVPDIYSDWRAPRQAYFDADRFVLVPPIPGEPHVLHRSALRHPLRARNRMHVQEADELARRKEPVK